MLCVGLVKLSGEENKKQNCCSKPPPRTSSVEDSDHTNIHKIRCERDGIFRILDQKLNALL